jgi:hypothetical protein
MRKDEIRNPGQALVYITDCNLATVCRLAGKKSRSKSEFERQKSIAQTAINWMQEMQIDFSNTRAADVVAAGSVDAWAAKFLQH